jgi:hypothetical protein
MAESKESTVYASSKSSSDMDSATVVQSNTTDVEKQVAIVQQSSEINDPNIVSWDGEDDPQNPMNWTSKAKIINCGAIIFLTLLTPLASSMFAPGVPDVLREFKETSVTLAAFVVSVYLLGFAVGPLIISPLSEIYGRRPVYVVCNVGFLIFTVACAVAHSMPQIIVFRFFAGCFGVCPVTLGGASIADMIPQEKRGGAMALYAMGTFIIRHQLLSNTKRLQALCSVPSLVLWLELIWPVLKDGDGMFSIYSFPLSILELTESRLQGLLADHHRLWSRLNSTLRRLQRNIRTDPSPNQDYKAAERNKQR